MFRLSSCLSRAPRVSDQQSAKKVLRDIDQVNLLSAADERLRVESRPRSVVGCAVVQQTIRTACFTCGSRDLCKLSRRQREEIMLRTTP